EVFLTDFQGRDLLTRVSLAVRADGRFLGLRADNVSNVGARCASLSPLGKGSALVTGSYDIPVATLRSQAVLPTRCRPTLTAARAGPKSPMRSSGSLTKRPAGSGSTASHCDG
ncbi:MAG: molybdopterin cofactor-binding domain-containing protein, partial [Stellaceae bacterium]